MHLPYILCRGVWRTQQIQVTHAPKSTRQIDDTLETQLKADWKHILATALGKGQKLWDSELYRLESLTEVDRSLHMQLSTIPFSIRKTISYNLETILKLGEAFFSKALYSSIIVRTADGHFCFIEKSQAYATNLQYSFVGGATSKSEHLIDSGVDLFGSAQAELGEEIGVSASEVEDFFLISIILTVQTHCCLVFFAQLSLTSEQLKERFARHAADEAERLMLLDRSDVMSFLHKSLPRYVIVFEVFDDLWDQIQRELGKVR